MAVVERELRQIKPFYRTVIMEAVKVQLINDPTRETRSRKKLAGTVPPFDAVPPVWQLRVREYRVYYDVDEKEKIVTVRAVRLKPAHKTTEGIL